MFDFFKERTDLTIGRETTQVFCYTNPKDAEYAQLIVCDPAGRIVEAYFTRRDAEIEVAFVPYMEGIYKIFETKFGTIRFLTCYDE